MNKFDQANDCHPLQTIFDQCIDQAVSGKGEDRHGHGTPFMEQPWRQIAKRQGIGFLVGQAEKKVSEATAYIQQHPGLDGVAFWQKEISGAINYLAMAMLYVEEQVAELVGEQCEACQRSSEKRARLEFDPVSGCRFAESDAPWFAEEYREHHGPAAWLFNPWTGERRDPRDIGTDPFGILIAPF